jgi:hypothetical protein
MNKEGILLTILNELVNWPRYVSFEAA